MGILNDLKKLFFGAESVAKSSVDKGVDAAKEASSRAAEKAEQLTKDVLDKTSGLKEAILHSAEGTINMVNKSEKLKKVAEGTERLSEKALEGGENLIRKGSELAENLGEKIISTGESLYQKGGKSVEKIGDKILGENQENLEKVKDFTEDVGSKVLKAKEEMVQKAKEKLSDLDSTIDETLAKAKEQEMREAAKPKKDLRTVLDENEPSMLDDEDDFFKKAEKFAEGDYGGVLEGQVTIQDTGESRKKTPAKAAGFTDLDGDGNELVDDAIVEGEEE